MHHPQGEKNVVTQLFFEQGVRLKNKQKKEQPDNGETEVKTT